MTVPEGKYWRGTVPASGVTVLFEPDEPSVDIIFIHGFTGHPERTWTSKKANTGRHNDSPVANESFEPPSKLRRLNPFSTSYCDGGLPNTAVYWPRDLIPTTVPYARVLTYGYDTRIRYPGGPPLNRNTVYDIAWDLLVALESERRTEPTRPVLFAAHSLGGIVVKEMLRRSRGCRMGQAYLHDIFESTAGIIFFGTPHAGSEPPNFLHRIAEKVVKAAGFSVDEQIVNALLPTSERLKELRDEFGPMAQDQNWIIHSFQEQIGIKILGQKVVDDTSSCLGMPIIETTEHIGRNHMEMCRFVGLDDAEYKKVAAALCRITTTVSRQPIIEEQSSLGMEQKRVLLSSLRFEQIDARQMNIRSAHAKTCKWLLEKSEYLDWLDSSKLGEHHGFLWIKGKPGTGKSTLMNFTLTNARKKMKDTVIMSFFFNARSNDLEKSTTGMYRSLLWQLLKQLPALQNVFDSLELATRTSRYPQWSVESLKALFEQAIQSLGECSLACFIDALDECNECQIRDMISFFEYLGKQTTSVNVQFRICFSSRHYPYIMISKGIGLTLEGQEGHNQDIIRFVNSELKIGQSKLAEQIRIDLQEKASGVFMWVVLVVQILNKEHDGGRIHALQKRLQDIPGDLHELFRDILTRDQHYRGELLLCVQWVLFAKQPLRPEQLYFAILSGTEPEALFEWDPDEITSPVIRRFILNSSKGLAEVTESKSPTVQFIHESVKDFLLKENGLKEIWSDLGTNLQGESHERLKQCCLTYIRTNVATSLDIAGSLPKANTQEAAELRQVANEKFPLLDYATRNVLYHADAAGEGGVDQTDFLRSFQLTNWIKLNNLFERHEVRRFTRKASLLYVLSERNMAALIRVHPSKQSPFDVEDERYGTPIFAALATGSKEAVKAFVNVHSKAQLQTPLLYDLCKQFAEDRNRCLKIGRNFSFPWKRGVLSVVVEEGGEAFLAFFIAMTQANLKDQNGRDPLSHAAEKGYETVVNILLSTKGVNVESKDCFSRTPLSYAAAGGHGAVVRLLLDVGEADVNLKDSFGRTPLSYAIGNRHEAVVRLLLDMSEVDVDLNDSSGRTPILCAAVNGQEAVVQLLLDTGKADADFNDSSGRTPLSHAAGNGHITVVQLLLDASKANVDLRDNSGWTPLSYAATNGHTAVVRLLLDIGKADVDLKDNSGRTPLSHAARSGHIAVVQLLLDASKADVDLRDDSGRTPLSYAATNGHIAVVRLLLDIGKADVDLKDNSGRTPLSHAAGNGHIAVLWLLLDTGKADVDLKDNSGRMPLSYMAGRGIYPLRDYEMILMLLEQQNKRRLLLARQEQDHITYHESAGGDYQAAA